MARYRDPAYALPKPPPEPPGFRGVDRNDPLGFLADQLARAKAFGNKAEIPYLGGVGDMVLGEAPETLDKLSWGEHVSKGAGQTYQLDPGVADVAMLPIPYEIARRTAKAGSSKLLNALDSMHYQNSPNASPESVSRRDALKKMGKYGIAAGIAGVGAKTGAKLLDSIAEAAPKTAVKTAAKTISTVKPATKSLLSYLRLLDRYVDIDVGKFLKNKNLAGLVDEVKAKQPGQEIPEIELRTYPDYDELAKEWAKDRGLSSATKYKFDDDFDELDLGDNIDGLYEVSGLDFKGNIDGFVEKQLDPGDLYGGTIGDGIYELVTSGQLDPKDIRKVLAKRLAEADIDDNTIKLVLKKIGPQETFMARYEEKLIENASRDGFSVKLYEDGLGFE